MSKKERVYIKFGTDGWRARIAEDYTFNNVRMVSQAIADYVNLTPNHSLRSGTGQASKKQKSKFIIVGYDRRFLSDEYAKSVSEVLAANRIKVLLTKKPVPTPAVAYAIKQRGLDGGVMITASHNPPQFNGIKFKTSLAAPADEKITQRIEGLIAKEKVKSLDFDLALKRRKIESVDVDSDYIKFVRGYVDMRSISSKRPKVLIDYMHGAGVGYIERILGKGSSTNTEALRQTRDPLFGGVNPEPIPKNLKVSLDHIRTRAFDLGVALDGDGDRIGAIRPDGKYITSGQIISLLLLHLLEDKNLSGAVAKTISGTTLIERICQRYCLKMFETPVGFKHISSLMLKGGILIGGEESGGIGFCGYIPERDGILSALLLIEMLAQRKKSLISIMNEIDRTYGKFRYDRIDMGYPRQKAKELERRLRKDPPKKIIGKVIKRVKTYDGIKFILEDDSWLLLRFSGTEPLIRIYAESSSESGVKRLLSEGQRIIESY